MAHYVMHVKDRGYIQGYNKYGMRFTNSIDKACVWNRRSSVSRSLTSSYIQPYLDDVTIANVKIGEIA